MAKAKTINLNQDLNKKVNTFRKRMKSQMQYKSELISQDLKFDWVEEIEFACPYIDNIMRRAKVTLIKEEDIVILEKAKKTSVATVKHLSKNTQNIDVFDEPEIGDVTPSKLLIERSEETFNTYENRFAYTLIDHMSSFVMRKEAELDNLKIKDDKTLEYVGLTMANTERVRIEMKIGSRDLAKQSDQFEQKIAEIRKKIKRIKQFIGEWTRTECHKALEKAHVPLVIPPLKKTNLILKNPNFQVATKLWDFLLRYDDDSNENKDNLNTSGDDLVLGLLDDAFLMNYFVLDSISALKREQKNKVYQYAIVMINQQLKRLISLFLASGIEISEKDILNLVTDELKNEKGRTSVDTTEVTNKFKSAVDEYLRQSQK